MQGFYSSDVRLNRWADEWVQRGPSPQHRGTLAAQLRLIRKRHGTPLARVYRNNLLWIGSYPPKRGG